MWGGMTVRKSNGQEYSDSGLEFGVSVGAGIEAMLTDKLSARIELQVHGLSRSRQNV
jgi:opacity protein-like surface antigen